MNKLTMEMLNANRMRSKRNHENTAETVCNVDFEQILGYDSLPQVPSQTKALLAILLAYLIARMSPDHSIILFMTSHIVCKNRFSVKNLHFQNSRSRRNSLKKDFDIVMQRRVF